MTKTTTRKKKWLKRIALGLVLALVAAVGVGLYFYKKTGWRPDWYRKKISPEALAQARQQSLAKMAAINNWMTDQAMWAASNNGSRDPVASDPTSAPARTYTLTLTENELNVMIEPFEADVNAKFGQYVSEPYIAVKDGHLILAILLKDAQKVLSVHVAPKVDKDGLVLAIDELRLGAFTVPRFLWNGYLNQVADQCRAKLDDVRERAAYLPNGNGNTEAVASAMNRLLLRSVLNQSADPVLFLPSDVNKPETGLPVRVTAVKIANETGLTLQLETLTHKERVHLLARLRAPYGEEPSPTLATDATAVAATVAK